jgi:Protein of unknown function (DUF1579)
MKLFICLTLPLFAACASTTTETAPQPIPEPTPEWNQLPQHEWLHQFLGEWENTSETLAGPGGEAVDWESTETIRSIGGLWIVSDCTVRTGGQLFTAQMTVGYDLRSEAFVGSWVDSAQMTLWTYEGQLDEDRRVLTLEAEGPSMVDPSRTVLYRDQLELIDADTKRMMSSVQEADGSWTVFMTAEGRRVN